MKQSSHALPRFSRLLVPLTLFVAACVAVEAQSYRVIHELTPDEGRQPMGCIFGPDGKLYGATRLGGSLDQGTVFSCNPDGSNYTVLHEFNSSSEGIRPNSLTLGPDGRLYGSCGAGGNDGSGTIFAINRDGSGFTILRQLISAIDGADPWGLILGLDGRFFGLNRVGGTNDQGTLFAFNQDGSGFSTIRSFDLSLNIPRALVQSTDGRLFGAGNNSSVTTALLFSVNPDGSNFSVLHDFDPITEGNAVWDLLEGTDGRLYGTASISGSIGGGGTVFAINKDGSGFVVLRKFAVNPDGDAPRRLLLAANGRLYGEARYGGLANQGTLFSILPDGTDFIVIHNFGESVDGRQPYATLSEGSDGKIYGATSSGGTYGNGVLFVLEFEPEITSSLTASGQVGESFNYAITASGVTEAFNAVGLPQGLAVNTSTGVISGTPAEAGVFVITLSASNSSGPGVADLTLTIDPGAATVTLGNLLHGFDGTPKSATVTTEPPGLAVAVTYDGSGTAPSAVGSYAVVVTLTDPNYLGSSSGTLVIFDPVAMPPVITMHPDEETVVAGQPASFTVVVSGTEPLSYQWRKGGVDIAGATSATYNIASTVVGNAGSYTVAVSNAFGDATSNQATLTVNAPPSIVAQPTVQTAVIGSDVVFSVVVAGTPPFTYQWKRNGVNVAGATESTLTVSDVQPGAGATYTVVVTNAAGSVTSNPATLALDTTPRLINVSCLASAGSGDSTLVIGFYLNGVGEKTLLIRGIGARLAQDPFNLPNTVADPQLRVYEGQTLIATNDDWDSALTPDFSRMGAFGLVDGSKDAALKITLTAPGLYTVHLVNNDPVADGIIEVYDFSRDTATRLTNVSSRLNMKANQIVTLGTALIANPQPVLARAIGPGLEPYILEPPSVLLVDPFLRVFVDQVEVASNDNWDSALDPYADAAGAFPINAGTADAVARVTPSPGSLTIQATGKGGTGVAIIELWESPEPAP